MTGRVRLLFFWAHKDDVGFARIRLGTSPAGPSAQWIDLLAGSDPEKAPRAVNRWGLAAESFVRSGGRVEASTFFGFMKVSKGSSTVEMQAELERERESGEYLFSAIIDHGGPGREFVKVLPFTSDDDYTVKDVARVMPSTLDRLAGSDGLVKAVAPGTLRACERAAGFLSTVNELIAGALKNPNQKHSLCFLYNGELRTLTLRKATRVPEQTIKLSLREEEYVRSYRDLLLAEFENKNEDTGKSSRFRLLLGTQGELRGLPVQIQYQPNWWFQVILNLSTPEPTATLTHP
jgi:hypothetical protein